MILTFGDIVDSILFSMGLSLSTVEPNVLTEIKRRINAVQSLIFYNRNWEWRKRTFYFNTLSPYETGTITATRGNRSITGSGTSWTNQHKLAYLHKNGLSYKVGYDTVTSTALKLKAGYGGDSISGEDYKLVYPDYILNNDLMSIINVRYNKSDLRLVDSSKMVLDKMTLGVPQEASIIGVTEEDLESTGSVTVSNLSKAVVGVGTDFATWMEGLPFRVDEFAEPYIIDTVTDGTHLTLRDFYQGDSGAGKSFKIGFRGQPVLRIGNIPDDYYWMEIVGLTRCKRLVNSNDVSMIPNHAPLLHGSIWFAMADLESKNPIRIQQARADFDRTLKELQETYKAVNGVVWSSAEEQQHRSSGLGNYDPFNRR